MNDMLALQSLKVTADATALRQLVMGFRTTQLLYVAARLRIADQLAAGARTPQDLARAVGADPDGLYRLLRALASLGILVENANGTFALTPMAELLRSDRPDSLRGLALLYGDPWLWQAYGRMHESVMSGRPVFAEVHGRPFYRYLDLHRDAAARFNEAMSAYSRQEAEAVLDAYHFSGLSTVVDVGGGYGALVVTILGAYPKLRGIVFDQPAVAAAGRRRLARTAEGGRIICIGGSFFEKIPTGGDLYLLKSILHNWEDEDALKILRCCRAAMSSSARLLVIERVIPPGDGTFEAKLFDVAMMVVLGGRERTEGEYRALFDRAGFELAGVTATSSPVSLIEGIPV